MVNVFAKEISMDLTVQRENAKMNAISMVIAINIQ